MVEYFQRKLQYPRDYSTTGFGEDFSEDSRREVTYHIRSYVSIHVTLQRMTGGNHPSTVDPSYPPPCSIPYVVTESCTLFLEEGNTYTLKSLKLFYLETKKKTFLSFFLSAREKLLPEIPVAVWNKFSVVP